MSYPLISSSDFLRIKNNYLVMDILLFIHGHRGTLITKHNHIISNLMLRCLQVHQPAPNFSQTPQATDNHQIV